MRPGGGRQKGAAFEREMAAALEQGLNVHFRRNLEQYREAEGADLITPNMPEFPFSIECKRYAEGEVRPEWWAQASAAAAKAGKYPALVYRFDRRDTYVIVPMSSIAFGVGNGAGTGDNGCISGCNRPARIAFEDFLFLCREVMAAQKGFN